MILDFIIFAVTGKLIIFFVQTFPLKKIFLIGEFFESGKFLHELVSCDLCLGFWVYLSLSFLLNLQVFELPFIISQVVTGMAVSFVMHLITIGWNEKFGIINVNME